MEVGTHTSNNIRYINIDELHSHLGKSLCKSFPAYRAFTGLDYTASFTRRGKVKPFKILEKSTEYQSAFIELTGDSEIKETTLQKIEEFVCVMYGKKKSTTVNDARLDMFLNKFKTKEDQRKNAAKALDGSSMRPCFSVLQEKIKRRVIFHKFGCLYLCHIHLRYHHWIMGGSGNKRSIHSLIVQRRKLPEVKHCY